MADKSLLIVGGGLAGLSAGCYALANGFKVTIVEHNLALGGVCTAWQRGPYLVDGCIHWLTGGPFLRLYEELGILPAVTLRTMDEFARYRHAREDWEVSVARDLRATQATLCAIGPEDAPALARLFDSIERFDDLGLDVEHPPELARTSDRIRQLWQARHAAAAFVRYRRSIGTWLADEFTNPRVRAVFARVFPLEMPAWTVLFVLGWLARGRLSRPEGGTAPFRDALIAHYRALGGEALVNMTVDEVLVTGHRATGLRLSDGTLLDADAVISTSSAPETVFRLLGGRYGAAAWKARMDEWLLFQPVVLASFGVERTFDDQPSTLILDDIHPLTVGDYRNDSLFLRIYNEDPAFAPPGHTVVQAMLPTSYDWWATRGTHYQHERDLAAEQVLGCIDRYLPGTRSATTMTDVATPLTFWRSARSWRGAYEGWMPTPKTFTHVAKTLPGLERFYMAGQWVEPGGGIPMAVMSGRHVAEIVCHAFGHQFRSPLEIASSHAQITQGRLL
jgi:phytoene desaturase